MMVRVIVLPLGTIVPDGGSTRVDVADAEVAGRALEVDLEAGVLEPLPGVLDAGGDQAVGHLDQLGALRDDEVDGLAAEEGAAACGSLRDDVALGDVVGVLQLVAVDLEALALHQPVSARSALLPIQSRILIGCGPLLTTRSTMRARLAGWCRPAGRCR